MVIWCISKYASLPQFGSLARSFYLCAEFFKLGHKPFLITSDSNHLCTFPETNNLYNFEKIENVNVCWIKTLKYSTTASVKRVLSWIDFEIKLFRFDVEKFSKPDVVIISSLSLFTIVYGFYLKKKFKAKLVLEIRDIWPLTMTSEGRFSRFHPLVLLMACLEKFGYKKSDLIVGTMPRLDLHIHQILGYSRPFFCSPIGFHDSKLNESIGKDKISRLIPRDKVIIGYAGSMGNANNLDPYINLINKYSDRSDIFFVFAGGGDLSQSIHKSLADNPNVIFLGKLSSEEVPAFLSLCDILYLSTHPSKVWDYGQSMNKVLEYMLAGKPIIASYSGYPSMINEAGSGYFVPVNDQDHLFKTFESLINLDFQSRANIGASGKAWVVKNRSYKKLAAEYDKKLMELFL